ncbi:UDP-glucose--hexose-1-phosphate uridylyltransferase [Mesobacillus subterraneus]|uniref:Galactose-1-phosphate uridylyltransferase n=1 Tax=Mesobacillus subterraneus TaxID=285983 RepID=A0A0D6Z7B0_9BACI|nr:UDP-glucose--hexose-1-phosphate uridylyltransferase [Mesobacillus subterraneus]KIY20906.1 galactose-1-phosphate uridylyltransferase [Mesobacillus subterraneus]
MPSIYREIEQLVAYGIQAGLLEDADKVFARNRILAVLKLDDWEDDAGESTENADLPSILKNILDWAADHGLLAANTVTERDILDTEIMNCLLPRPSEVIRNFEQKYHTNPQAATEYFYHLSSASHYIREDRIKKNKQWKTMTPYGEIDITINLSKPEKDPKEIALLKDLPSSNYPECLLCKENEGYKGTLRHPARATHRIIPLTLNEEGWYLQYSPYVYYNEHCIVFRDQHIPMKISAETFNRLLDFTEQFPHYFLGSNADIPIVGGSILSHDHFQGGNYRFALEKAEEGEAVQLDGFPSVIVAPVKWPMSVIRVRGKKAEVAAVSTLIYQKWLKYSDPSVGIFSETDGVPHNTVTPIARRRGDLFEIDVVLRNNRTSAEHPDGIFHPHKQLHHIKKENIGLIEVMGLAVLPGRLESELSRLAAYVLAPPDGKENWQEDLLKHWDWYHSILKKYHDIDADNVGKILEDDVGKIFLAVLEDAGVFKQDEQGLAAFTNFIQLVTESRDDDEQYE